MSSSSSFSSSDDHDGCRREHDDGSSKSVLSPCPPVASRARALPRVTGVSRRLFLNARVRPLRACACACVCVSVLLRVGSVCVCVSKRLFFKGKGGFFCGQKKSQSVVSLLFFFYKTLPVPSGFPSSFGERIKNTRRNFFSLINV
jgi:hypothetical protein